MDHGLFSKPMEEISNNKSALFIDMYNSNKLAFKILTEIKKWVLLNHTSIFNKSKALWNKRKKKIISRKHHLLDLLNKYKLSKRKIYQNRTFDFLLKIVYIFFICLFFILIR